MPDTVVSAGHTIVNITKIPALTDSNILSNETLRPLKKKQVKGQYSCKIKNVFLVFT